MSKWYDKYLSIYGKSFDEIPDSLLDEIKSKLAQQQSDEPLVSIVVIAYNEEKRLAACLWSLSELQTTYPIEILGVNNNSKDRTEQVYQRLGLPYFNESKQSPGFARQCGLENARGKYHFCIDADSIYRDFQESLREAVKEDDLLGSDVNAVMVVYVDGTGEVKGRDIRITAGDETVKIRYINAEKGSKFGTDFRVEIPDEFTITVTGGGTKRDDYIKGTLDAKVIADGETRKIATIEIDGNTKDNDFVGDISFIPSEELLDGVLANADLPSEIQDLVRGVKLTLSNHSTKDHLDMALSLSSGSDELLTLQLKSSTADPLDLTVPSSSVDVETWANSISQLNLMALIGNLQEAGIPMSLFSSLAGIS